MATPVRILIDGSNVIHAWPELRALLPARKDEARSRLVERVRALHEAGTDEVIVVFDGRGESMSVTSQGADPAVLVVYTAAGQTADTVIEQFVGRAPHPENCRVVTADRAERQTVEALGAVVLPPEDLAAWIDRAERRVGSKLERRRAENDQKWRGKGKGEGKSE